MQAKYAVKFYFYGTNRWERGAENGLGLIAFAVPDIGFAFRSAHKGNALECEYYALMNLCQFVEANVDLFKGQKLEFLGDSTAVVHQAGQTGGSSHSADHSLNAHLPLSHAANGNTTRLLARLRTFKGKLGFSLRWVPLYENRAAGQLASLPKVKNSPLVDKLNTSFLETFKSPKNPNTGSSSF